MRRTPFSSSSPRTNGAYRTRTGCSSSCARQWRSCPASSSPSRSRLRCALPRCSRGARGDLAVKIFGPDLKVLANLAGRVRTAIASVRGASEVFTASNATVDYLQIDMDRLAAGRTGLSVTRIEDELRALLEGAPAGIVVEAQRRTNIVIRGPETLREAPELFTQSQLAAGDGGLVRIGDVAHLRRTAGAVKVDRENAWTLRNRAGLCVRSRSRRLRGGRAESRRRQGATSGRLPSSLGRPIREPAARGHPSRHRRARLPSG